LPLLRQIADGLLNVADALDAAAEGADEGVPAEGAAPIRVALPPPPPRSASAIARCGRRAPG
jgi:hypothetical protein